MDLIDRQAMMNYVRSNKINIGQVAHIVIMKQESVNAVSEEVYTEEFNLRKDAELKVYKLERAIKEIKEEIRHLITKNMEVGIDGIYPNEYVYCYEDVLKIIDEKVKEYTS